MHRYAEEPPVEERVGVLLRDRGESLATAESATSGLVSALVTEVPGSSDYFDRGVVTYSYEAKMMELCVDREALDSEGAVSAEVARQMAAGVRDVSGSTWGLSTTGVAGPSGEPVGLVFVGVAFAADLGSGDSYVVARERSFEGTRSELKERFARAALRALESELESVGVGDGV
ncbi:MAG: CinA family protein [Halobacteriota archaeon]